MFLKGRFYTKIMEKENITRRDFLKKIGKAGVAVGVMGLSSCAGSGGSKSETFQPGRGGVQAREGEGDNLFEEGNGSHKDMAAFRKEIDRREAKNRSSREETSSEKVRRFNELLKKQYKDKEVEIKRTAERLEEQYEVLVDNVSKGIIKPEAAKFIEDSEIFKKIENLLTLKF